MSVPAAIRSLHSAAGWMASRFDTLRVNFSEEIVLLGLFGDHVDAVLICSQGWAWVKDHEVVGCPAGEVVPRYSEVEEISRSKLARVTIIHAFMDELLLLFLSGTTLISYQARTKLTTRRLLLRSICLAPTSHRFR